MKLLDRKVVIGDKVIDFRNNKKGVVQKLEEPPAKANGVGTDVFVKWTDGKMSWIDAGDIGILAK